MWESFRAIRPLHQNNSANDKDIDEATDGVTESFPSGSPTRWLPCCSDLECFSGLIIELEMIETGEDLRDHQVKPTHFTYAVAERPCFNVIYPDLWLQPASWISVQFSCDSTSLCRRLFKLWTHLSGVRHTLSSSSLGPTLQECLGAEDARAIVWGTGHLGKNSEDSVRCLSS